jgi:hypothetical protein
MNHTIKAIELFSASQLDLDIKDPQNALCYDYQQEAVKELQEALPDKYKNIDLSVDVIYQAVNHAYNQAMEQSYVDEVYTVQGQAVNRFLDDYMEMVNRLTGTKALQSITLAEGDIINSWDLSVDHFVVTYDVAEAKKAIIDVIDGEGMFNGKNCVVTSKDVQEHLFWLFKRKLIGNIYGDNLRFEWDTNGVYSFDNDYFNEMLSDNLSEININDVEKKQSSDLKAIQEVQKLIN